MGWILVHLFSSILKVEEGRSQRDTGNEGNAFINALDAPRGNHVTVEAADILIEDAEALIMHYQSLEE